MKLLYALVVGSFITSSSLNACERFVSPEVACEMLHNRSSLLQALALTLCLDSRPAEPDDAKYVRNGLAANAAVSCVSTVGATACALTTGSSLAGCAALGCCVCACACSTEACAAHNHLQTLTMKKNT